MTDVTQLPPPPGGPAIDDLYLIVRPGKNGGPTAVYGAPAPAAGNGSGLSAAAPWAANTAYAAGSVVTIGGSSYVAPAAIPAAASFAPAGWLLLAAKGDPGPAGAAGTIGATGAQGPKGDTGASGAAGVSVTGASFNGSGHLILTLSNSTTIDAGIPPGGWGGGSGASSHTADSTTTTADSTTTTADAS